MTNLYRELLNWADEGRRITLVTVLVPGPLPEYPLGSKWVLSESGEQLWGKPIPEFLKDDLKSFSYELWRSGRALSKTISTELGAVELYGEPVQILPRLYLFGGGHVSKSVAEVAALAGFRVEVVEDRPEFSDPRHFPEGTRFHVGPWEEVVPALKYDPALYLVILTRAHAYDQWILGQIIEKPYKYLGMIGSRKKVQKIFDNLRQNNVDPELIANVHAPIGLDIGAQTPGEIAISIVAEMIAIRYGTFRKK